MELEVPSKKRSLSELVVSEGTSIDGTAVNLSDLEVISAEGLETSAQTEKMRPPKRFTTAKDRREHRMKQFGERVRKKDEESRAQWSVCAENDEKDETVSETVVKEPRKPKRKVAVLIGFCGIGYQGMQINRNAKTIEDELYKAFVAAGAVSKDNADDPKKVGLMRAARTDKGVHAAGNVVSLKMVVDIPSLIERINENLPDQIRVWGIVRVIRSFHAKTLCDSRIYEYLIPTYAFQPFKQNATTKSNSVEGAYSLQSGQNQTSTERNCSSTWVDIPVTTPEEMVERWQYRIPRNVLELVRKGFATYEGTHNFHNYTTGRAADDCSCNRYIVKFEVSEPKMMNNIEWLSLRVHGQAFMLHQIRKMVALVALLVRTQTPLSLIPLTFMHNKINIPSAPALGLLLEQPLFTSYNRKARDQGKALVDFDMYRDKIEAFKSKFIYSKIYEQECADCTFQNWLNGMDAHLSIDFAYLNSDGIIPENAIIKTNKQDNSSVANIDSTDFDADVHKVVNQSIEGPSRTSPECGPVSSV